jgi:hypothetical protein
MSPIFAKMSVAMDAPEQSVVRPADHERRGGVETATFWESTAPPPRLPAAEDPTAKSHEEFKGSAAFDAGRLASVQTVEY